MTTITALMELMPHLPVGFRFHPTDEEVVIHYLHPQILGIDPHVSDVIPLVDVYKWEPSELPRIFAENSVIKSNDPEWWFSCPRDPKYSNSNRSNRATVSGFWKKTGKDLLIKARGTDIVIGTKKILVFHTGRVRNAVRTDWVMHEYHLHETLPNPNQTALVICRVMNKADDITNASIFDGGEPSSSNTIPAPHDHDFSSSQQLPMNNQQQSFLGNVSSADAGINDWTMVESEFDLTEQEEVEFVDSIFTVPEDYSYIENMHPSIFKEASTSESLRNVYYGDGGLSSDTDTDRVQAPFQQVLGTSNLCTTEYREMRMVKTQSGALPSVYSAADKQINCIALVSPEPPVTRKTFKPQDQRRSHNFVAERTARRRNQLQKHNTAVDLQQKEKSIMESDKERKMADGTNAKKGLKLTTDESAGSNRKGCSCFIFLESSPLSHESRPPSEYFFNVVLGIFLFAVVIREVVLYYV